MPNENKEKLKELQLKMLRVQQGVFHSKKRIIIAIEGMDAAGKGGAIRRITENLDPRGLRVYPIGAPTADEQGRHYLYRFWQKIPSPGMMAIFDRSWYGRVLVERVEKLIPKKRWQDAFTEINQFEKLLIDDGVKIIKICLKISKTEQLKRFKERLSDPYKQWKITPDDIKNRSHWSAYMRAHQEMVEKTSTKICPWHVVETDDKDEARLKVLQIITSECQSIATWMEDHAEPTDLKALKKALRNLR
jgi:polyphosphate kinase 2 (PPK2 family)